MKSSSLPKLQGGRKAAPLTKANKNIGIRRSISPLRDQHADRNENPKPVYPPGKSSNHHVEKSGNRYGA